MAIDKNHLKVAAFLIKAGANMFCKVMYSFSCFLLFFLFLLFSRS